MTAITNGQCDSYYKINKRDRKRFETDYRRVYAAVQYRTQILFIYTYVWSVFK